MAWTWRMETADGTARTDLAAPSHQNQSDAESWLGEQWRDLAAKGIARVSLLEDGVEVYGPMPLSAD